jgi:hypothetical protein
VLEGLALQHASGALEIDGSPAGTVYLDRGHITFARTTWSPDLGARLAGLLPASSELRDLLLSADHPEGGLGDLLVQRGLIAPDVLGTTLRSVIVDALIVLTVPLAEEARVSDIRLQTPRAHWAGAFCRLSVDAARTEAVARARRMTRDPIPRSARLELRDLATSRAVLTRAQWTVACQIDGTLTCWDLAWRCGLALSDTFEAAGALARAGLCAPGPGPGAGPVLAARPTSAVADITPARTLATPAPVPLAAEPARSGAGRRSGAESRSGAGRRSGAGTMALADAGAGAEAEDDAGQEAPPLDSLRRVLDGLRRLN